MTLAPSGGTRNGEVGFALSGPVDLRGGGLPVARLRYTQIAGARQGGATFISDGRRAYAEVAGTAYRLPAGDAAGLEAAAGAVRGNARLPVGSWIRAPRLLPPQSLFGVQADHVSGRLDAAIALRDIFGAAQAAGAGGQVPDLSGAGADEVRRAIEGASVDVWSGRADHLLRRLRLSVRFRLTPPASLRQSLGDAAGGRFSLALDLDHPNAPVHVRPPSSPRPASALPGR
jgi:hypothetical protein